MLIFEQGDIVRVPFPYTDRNTRQRRPALVVSRGPIGAEGTLLWVNMVTSAENLGWPEDLDLGPNFKSMGLPIRSIVRPAKIATIEAKDAEPIGKVDPATLRQVLTSLRAMLVAN